MTDYNDGKWHGWNGGECPVDPASMVDVHYVNAFGGYGRDENRLAGQHSWALACLFRVTKPAPPKPREFWITIWDGLAWDDQESAETHNKTLKDSAGPIIHVVEKLP